MKLLIVRSRWIDTRYASSQASAWELSKSNRVSGHLRQVIVCHYYRISGNRLMMDSRRVRIAHHSNYRKPQPLLMRGNPWHLFQFWVLPLRTMVRSAHPTRLILNDLWVEKWMNAVTIEQSLSNHWGNNFQTNFVTRSYFPPSSYEKTGRWWPYCSIFSVFILLRIFGNSVN